VLLGDFSGFSLILNMKYRYLFYCWSLKKPKEKARTKNTQSTLKMKKFKKILKDLPHWDLLHRQFSGPPQRLPRFHFLGPQKMAKKVMGR
jgi:hypothetical protein